ncbi:ABC transporter permease, partial [uncultured Halomonas sp.]|uniref:ABC transporter permease n=1 Tax=uncultured Halomonas sp. TaxID=173971 RepID=UPI0026112B74
MLSRRLQAGHGVESVQVAESCTVGSFNAASHAASRSLWLFTARVMRSAVIETLGQDYIRTARAKGLSEGRVIFVHVLKNLMIPVVTIIGLEFGSVIAFSVVTETIFSWPGMGKLIIESINLLDRPVIVAYLMIIVLL